MSLHDDAREIFLAGVRRVDPALLMDRALRLQGESLTVSHAGGRIVYELAEYRHIVAVGMGKASAALASELERILEGRIDLGFVVTKTKTGVSCSRIRLAEGGHPLPDARSVQAGAEILAIAEKVRDWEAAGEHSLIIVLVSGGGSALLSAPRPLRRCGR
ncbi:MAG: DUF4147 domain-containing protein [Spirochaetes bacterium]|nr:DUF4147 domain-containing protein [Spirochaetota bacterium]